MDTTVAVKVAVTVIGEDVTTEQEPAPEQAPDQPMKVKPVLGVAVRVSTVPVLKLTLQVAPQEIPKGVEATMPPPLLMTESGYVIGAHASVLQVCEEAPAHVAPPFAGVGLVQVRYFVPVSPQAVTEHVP